MVVLCNDNILPSRQTFAQATAAGWYVQTFIVWEYKGLIGHQDLWDENLLMKRSLFVGVGYKVIPRYFVYM